jgi:hypothetical protein
VAELRALCVRKVWIAVSKTFIRQALVFSYKKMFRQRNLARIF